jgi:hypothetical protein
MFADPSAQLPRFGVTRKALRFVALGAVAYCATLVATLPADVALPAASLPARLGGTLWHGDALLAGGSRIEWRWAPLRSLASLGLAVDWHATGAGTDLAGQALLHPGAIRIDGMGGHADGAFLAEIAPDLPFTCNVRFAVDLPQIATGGDAPHVAGEILSDAGTCRNKAAGSDMPVLPLAIVAGRAAGGSRVSVAPQGQRRLRLVEVTIEPDRLDLAITPAGARALPFLAPNGAVTMSLEL